MSKVISKIVHKSLEQQVYDILQSKYKPGTSKRLAKQNGTSSEYIFSSATKKGYTKICRRFVSFCKKRYGCKTLGECLLYTGEFVRRGNKNGKPYSPSTMKTYACALAKLYDVEMHDICDDLPLRERKDFKNSRGDPRYAEEGIYKDQIRLVKATNLRCHEVRQLRGNDYRINPDGTMDVHVRRGKNGKERWTRVIQDQDWVLALMRFAGKEKVFMEVPQGLHRYRSQYATELYKSLARPLDQIPREDRYYCRKELKGVVYDKRAMRIVSQNLGHTRIEVIARSYLMAWAIMGQNR